MTDDGDKPRKKWLMAADASSIGIEIAVAITVGAVGGFWIERNVTHWSPWTSLLGLALGIATAISAVVRTARGYNRRMAQSAEDGDDGP